MQNNDTQSIRQGNITGLLTGVDLDSPQTVGAVQECLRHITSGAADAFGDLMRRVEALESAVGIGQ